METAGLTVRRFLLRRGPFMRRTLFCLLVLGVASPAAAAPKSFEVATKVGRSNVKMRVVLHPQADKCSAKQIDLLKAKALKEGSGHIRAHLAEVTAKAKTDASGPKEFFGLGYLGGCPADGGVWIAFPAQGPDRAVARFSPGDGWSPMAPL
jgi:hypothetical protein